MGEKEGKEREGRKKKGREEGDDHGKRGREGTTERQRETERWRQSQ